MRKRCVTFLLSLAVFLPGVNLAGEEKPTAVIEDTAGQSTEVSDIGVSIDSHDFDLCGDSCLVVKTGALEICIRLDTIVSIVQTGKLWTVKYFIAGQEITAEGELQPVGVNGKSDLGDFNIWATRIRRMDFKSPPYRDNRFVGTGSPVLARLNLLDGSIIPVTSLRRFYRYMSRERYIGDGGPWRTQVEETIDFTRGESSSAVAMQDIAKVEFGADNTVSVTLKNGKTATGTTVFHVQFCGTFEKGCFVIEKKSINSIEFVGGAK